MAWIKREAPVEQPVEETPVAVETAAEESSPAAPEKAPKKPRRKPRTAKKEAPKTEEPAATEATEEAPAASRRRTKRGLRRGRHTVYAVVGLLVLVFAVIGVIATVVTGVRTVKKLRDTSYLKEDMYYTLLPLAQYVPTAFDTVEEADQAPLIQAALYEITFREEIRQRQDMNYKSPYQTDEFGRTIVPVSAVTEAYHKLFGNDHTPTYQSFGYENASYYSYEYDAEKKEYHVPQTSSGAYEHAIGTIHRAGDLYTVQVGYVHLQDITVDDRGNKVVDIAKSTYYQYYTVEKMEDGSFVIRAVADEEETK